MRGTVCIAKGREAELFPEQLQHTHGHKGQRANMKVSAASHGPPRITGFSAVETVDSDFFRFHRALGLPKREIARGSQMVKD